MSEADTPTYIGRAPCGCVVTAVIDDPDASTEAKRRVAKDVAGWIRRGLAVERVTVQDVRNGLLTGCQCPKPVQKTFDFRQNHHAKAGAP